MKNQLLIEYLHNVLRDERSMLKDGFVREFLEIYYNKVAAQLPVARMIYTINYGMHSKDDIDELCGDLFAIRIIAQATGVPTSVRKELRGSLKALQNKSERFKKEIERGMKFRIYPLRIRLTICNFRSISKQENKAGLFQRSEGGNTITKPIGGRDGGCCGKFH